MDQQPRNHWLIDNTPIMSLLAIAFVVFTKLMYSLPDVVRALDAAMATFQGWLA